MTIFFLEIRIGHPDRGLRKKVGKTHCFYARELA